MRRAAGYIGGGAALLFAVFLLVRGEIGPAVSIGLIGLGLLALLWQIFSGTGFPNQFFNDFMGGRLLEGRPW